MQLMREIISKLVLGQVVI